MHSNAAQKIICTSLQNISSPEFLCLERCANFSFLMVQMKLNRRQRPRVEKYPYLWFLLRNSSNFHAKCTKSYDFLDEVAYAQNHDFFFFFFWGGGIKYPIAYPLKIFKFYLETLKLWFITSRNNMGCFGPTTYMKGSFVHGSLWTHT